ncbi:MAG: DUF3426 domain-containing protein [bacterium]
MILQCPQCKTKYSIDDEQIKPEGTQVRCSRCRLVFETSPEDDLQKVEAASIPVEGTATASGADIDMAGKDFLGLDDEDDFESMVSGADKGDIGDDLFEEDREPAARDDFGAAFEDDLLGGLGEPEESVSTSSVRGSKASEVDESALAQSSAEPSASDEEVQEDESREQAAESALLAEESETKEPTRKTISGLTIGLLIILLLLLLGAGGYYFYSDIKPYLPSWLSERIPGSENSGYAQKNEQQSDGVEDISLFDVRQYFVTNDKIGQLFVIEGRAANNYSQAKDLIKLQASVYDGAGSVIESKQFLAGNTISLFQLQVLSREEIESALQSKVGVLTNNKNVRPGAEVPFMVVFFSPPEEVQEFGVKVVDIQEPQ